MKNFIKHCIKTLLKWKTLKPLISISPGHFYSPIVSRSEVDEFEKLIWNDDEPQGVDLNTSYQKDLIEEFNKNYEEIPFFCSNPQNRFFFENGLFEQSDAFFLYSFLRHFCPENVIEVGSGFSSALMLDTKDAFLKEIDLTFIEPYTDVLFSLFRNDDLEKCRVVQDKVQNVEVETFKKLKKNDILFVDSSHVSKTGSDVNFILFKVLPVLNSGVIIHFHDIFYPFEYPKDWVYGGRNWNECYILRAFLSYNSDFEILVFSDYLHKHHPELFERIPMLKKNTGGSLWIRKK